MFSARQTMLLCCLCISLASCVEHRQGEETPFARALAVQEPPCTVHEIVSPSTFDTTERSGVSGDGRVFFIGTRPVAGGDPEAWLSELVRDASGAIRTKDMLSGHLAGTTDGKLGGSAAGDACTFSGMAVRGSLVYAACYAGDGRASLVQVDLSLGTVRAGELSTCNTEPSVAPCKAVDIYANGMAIDSQGRVYASSMLAYLSGVANGASILQFEVSAPGSDPARLDFRYRPWITHDVVGDGFAPNGVQIYGDTLYYAAGANINGAQILADGKAGTVRVKYNGIPLTYIDDFSVRDGTFVLARTFPLDIAEIAPNRRGFSRVLGTCDLPELAIPSSVTTVPASPSATPIFAAETTLVTSYYGGGIYTLNRTH
jgi:hypothetical protein